MSRFIFFIYGLLIIIAGCSDGSMVFDRKIWDEKDTVFINNKRYNMALWLKKNYQFCDKTPDDIRAYLGLWDDVTTSDKGESGALIYTLKQQGAKGIDPPYDVAYLHIGFNKSNVTQAYISERKDKESEYIKLSICPL